MANVKPKTGAGLSKPNESSSQSNNDDRVFELEDRIAKLQKENSELKQVKPSHSLNLKSKPTLGYWNIRGLGAPVRYLLYFCGVDFTDKMYRAGPPPEYDRSDWLNEKFNLGLPLPNLPYLIDEDGAHLTETVAIMKYIASKWKPELLGKDPQVLGNVEMIQAFVLKLKEVSTGPCYTGQTN